MFKVDLHTHSIVSPDGGISPAQYQRALSSNLLDCIAITDHNRIDLALDVHAQLGERIIVGEEIMTNAGELVGLYLSEVIKPGQSPLETVKQIKDQGGLVYLPHPFETMRKGLHPQATEEIAHHIDIIEVCNGRAFLQNRSQQAVVWARINQKLSAASSDAHGYHGLGKTYTSLSALPTSDTLLGLLDSGVPMTNPPSVRALLYPKYHRLRKKLGNDT